MKHSFRYFILICLAIVLVLFDLTVGAESIKFSEMIESLWNPHADNEIHRSILLEFRLPRVFSAILSGIGLSIGGLLMQTYFRNPLAGPYVLGIGAGASFGVAIYTLGSFFFSWLIISSWGLVSFAFIGAFSVMLLIGLFSLRFKNNVSILIIGLMFSYLISALVTFLQSIAPPELVKQFVVWGMGSFTAVHSAQIPYFLALVLAGWFLAWNLRNRLDAYYLSDFEVQTLGVSIKLVRNRSFLAVALLVAGVTAFCGPIAFLGMAVPHITRMIFKNSKHHYLILQSSVVGVILAILFDIFSQNPFGNQPIPLNTIASILGAPMVIWLIWKRRAIS
ncbi:MAG: iron ABC transporter permease [Flavobacteriales bacterium]|jgi:iron complex transport system permease protein|nr:iron ABC transporter permease [Flavobacteriales bacterium]